ncbi:MAG: BsuBI/PstI family type II restriction endonuclease [Acidimicrobiaceae bacterium]|uniref:BsuBI/PstI family type II restriction endonuclease n=1 Tax=Candidatus Poriferisodalis multihospitum TaxID=2983191 RepID=UPI00239950C8|nr:BsuBI/PstI family type II restriction endonuclease [Candidatus Poriferisodalis multihospitum]MDE0499537.1 BsuBI/PstI family type II restriction endonuclease [Acidimicrobiaceae bacterium]
MSYQITQRISEAQGILTELGFPPEQCNERSARAFGAVWYIGDADEKFAVYDDESFTSAGISIPHHGKMPDVIVKHADESWLVVVEAVTSHGPIDPKRRAELEQLLRSARLGLVYVTAFEDRATFRQYIADIAWETEVWIAESPDHLIHFDGSKFLGPYS